MPAARAQQAQALQEDGLHTEIHGARVVDSAWGRVDPDDRHMTSETSHLSSDSDVSLLDFLVVAAESWKLLVLGPLAAGLAALALSFAITPTFTARTTFLPPQQQQGMAAAALQNLGALAGLAGGVANIKNPADQYISLLESNGVVDRLIERFNLANVYQTQFQQHTRNALRGATRIQAGKDGLMSVEVDDESPERAAALANAYAEELSAMLSRLALTEAQQRRMFFERQLEQTKESLAKAESSLKAVGISPDVLKKSPEVALAGVAALRAAIAQQQLRLHALRGVMTDRASEYQQAVRQLQALQSQLEREERNSRPDAATADDYTTRYREYKYQETLFELFAKQYELAKVDESREGALLQIVDKAAAPELKSKPKKALIAMMTTLGTGFVLLVFVFVRHAFREAADRPEHARRLDRIRRAFAFGRRAGA